MNITNQPPAAILKTLTANDSELANALSRARANVPAYKREIAQYQAAAIYALAKAYNGKRILEIGTAWGYSAAIMAEACPDSEIITLNPTQPEDDQARRNLKPYKRVSVLTKKSWDYLKEDTGNFDLIFIDGDHARVRHDMPFWDKLNEGGLFLFHDYAPAGATEGKGGKLRECPPVYEEVNRFAEKLNKERPDVLVVDDGGVGIAGFYKGAPVPVEPRLKELETAHLFSINSYDHLKALYTLATRIQDTAGAIVDCGCGAGGSALAIYAGARKGKRDKREVLLLDNFTGIPKPDAQADGAKAVSKWEAQAGAWCKADLERLHEGLELAGIKTAKVYPHDWRLGLAIEGEIAFLHIDATLHSSTLEALKQYYPQVVSGGVIAISAYGHWNGIKSAVNEFSADADVDGKRWRNLDSVNVYLVKE